MYIRVCSIYVCVPHMRNYMYVTIGMDGYTISGHYLRFISSKLLGLAFKALCNLP